MATRGETGWQEERTVLECNRYMLENEVATDVCFEVGPPDGAVVNIRAHKYMLISRSPVFEAMFSSGMTECNSGPDHRIRIEDIEANTFKDVLMYIYCEHADITLETSFTLMYAAKKYMIPKLVEMCIRNIEEGINESNACYLLEQSLVFCEEELAAKCVNVIAEHSDKLLLEKKLLSASRQAVETVLGSNELRSREPLVYEFCLQWAKEQLLIHQGIQNPTDEQIRETLGGLVYLIRFPIMDSEEFGELVGQRNILNSEEKLSLYYYLTTRNGVNQLTFCAQKRNFISGEDEEFCVDRVVKCDHGIWGGNTDAIDFLTGDDVVLTGVGLYSGYSTDYVAQIEIMASLGWQSEKTLAECMRYMLDNEIATDVCFEVGPEDGPTVEIRAHKFMLISRCPVFEAMMSTEMAETKDEKEAKIRIVDIDEEVFKQLLSFIYCDSVSIDLASAPTLLYSARKYLLPRLTAFCSKYLHSMLQCNNVCEILELSFTYDVEDLKIQCIEFVANNSETVLNDDELLTLSRESFEAIIKVDRMMSGPSTLFNSCVKWAKHQIKIEQSFEAPSDLQIRETLGSFLYEIPFPTISYTEFANLVGESDVLTTDEKSAIYYYLASGKGKLKFNKVSRHERLINLATKITTGFWPQPTCSSCGISKKSPSEITFKTNKDILLTGIGLYKGHDGSDYAIDIQVIKKDYSLPPEKRRCKRIRQISTAPLESQAHSGSTFTIAPLSESSTTFKVSFDEPISIDKGILYTVSAMNYEVIGCCGELCKELIVEDVTFTCVSASPIPSGSLFGNNSASLSSGQSGSISSFVAPANNSTVLTIPHLYFIPM